MGPESLKVIPKQAASSRAEVGLADAKELGAMGSQCVRNSMKGIWLRAWKPGSEAHMAGLASEGVEGVGGKQCFTARKLLPRAPQRPFRDLTHLLSRSIWAPAQRVLGARIFWMCQK